MWRFHDKDDYDDDDDGGGGDDDDDDEDDDDDDDDCGGSGVDESVTDEEEEEEEEVVVEDAGDEDKAGGDVGIMHQLSPFALNLFSPLGGKHFSYPHPVRQYAKHTFNTHRIPTSRVALHIY
ncbi:unnamed protein product [Schistocephalus solidus]|uniref:Uncharacterized protein n=1 Tax=Schistocephalus solidus TaxID=70667 RepID=A0A183SCW1_SCHSO|nr:unnamed protein product [Schistocephalus solidus]